MHRHRSRRRPRRRIRGARTRWCWPTAAVFEGQAFGASGFEARLRRGHRGGRRSVLQHCHDGLSGDPHQSSYADQIVRLPLFPISALSGTNPEDIEATEPGGARDDRAGRCGRPVELSRTGRHSTAGWRSTTFPASPQHRHARTDVAHSREPACRTGSIAHSPDGTFDIAALTASAREFPGLAGLDLAKDVSCRQSYTWRETPWALGRRLWRPADNRSARGRARLWREAQHPAPACGAWRGDRRAARRCELRRCDALRAATACSSPTVPVIRRRLATYAIPTIKALVEIRAYPCSASASVIRCSRSRWARARARWRRAITARTIR